MILCTKLSGQQSDFPRGPPAYASSPTPAAVPARTSARAAAACPHAAPAGFFERVLRQTLPALDMVCSMVYQDFKSEGLG